jgi:hypothetical protein
MFPDPGTFPQQRTITLHADQYTSCQCMMIPAESCTCPAQAVMINLDMVTINGREDPAAGTRGHRTDRNIVCCTSSAFLLAYKNTPLPKQPVHPVLCGASGNIGSVLDIGYRKKTVIEGELPHQAQVLAPALKHAGHSSL